MVAEFESKVLTAIQQELDENGDVFTNVVTTVTIDKRDGRQIITATVSRKKT